MGGQTPNAKLGPIGLGTQAYLPELFRQGLQILLPLAGLGWPELGWAGQAGISRITAPTGITGITGVLESQESLVPQTSQES